MKKKQCLFLLLSGVFILSSNFSLENILMSTSSEDHNEETSDRNGLCYGEVCSDSLSNEENSEDDPFTYA